MIYEGKSQKNGWFRGTPIYGNPQIVQHVVTSQVEAIHLESQVFCFMEFIGIRCSFSRLAAIRRPCMTLPQPMWFICLLLFLFSILQHLFDLRHVFPQLATSSPLCNCKRVMRFEQNVPYLLFDVLGILISAVAIDLQFSHWSKLKDSPSFSGQCLLRNAIFPWATHQIPDFTAWKCFLFPDISMPWKPRKRPRSCVGTYSAGLSSSSWTSTGFLLESWRRHGTKDGEMRSEIGDELLFHMFLIFQCVS